MDKKTKKKRRKEKKKNRFVITGKLKDCNLGKPIKEKGFVTQLIPSSGSYLCPICKNKLKPKKTCKYHVSYKPEIIVVACTACNLEEYLLRLNKETKNKKRREMVRCYQLKYAPKHYHKYYTRY